MHKLSIEEGWAIKTADGKWLWAAEDKEFPGTGWIRLQKNPAISITQDAANAMHILYERITTYNVQFHKYEIVQETCEKNNTHMIKWHKSQLKKAQKYQAFSKTAKIVHISVRTETNKTVKIVEI